MQTIHLTNQSFIFSSTSVKWLSIFFGACVMSLILIAPNVKQVLVTVCLSIVIILFGYMMMIRAVVRFTLTATHLQQHLYKGGWVTQWCNIEKIGRCVYTDNDGWQHPLPWVGIKLKNYSPYLESICPRIITEILFNQRSLLYLGAKQQNHIEHFEDMVLDSKSFTTSQGEQFEGLQAMLANRMQYQRGYYDYDIFIPENDLDRPVEEFIGLARRYLAAGKHYS